MLHIHYSGFSIIEIVIACAIFLSTVAAFVTGNDILRQMSADAADKTEAALLVEEGFEALLLLRDIDWDANIASLTLETPYHLYWDGDSYELSSNAVVIEGRYQRQVSFFDVRRDGTGAISSTGTIDPDTRRVRIEIWRVDPEEMLVVAEMLVHNDEE
jgi:hypothetical protein